MAAFIGTGSLSYAAGGTCYRCTRNENLVDCDVHIVAEGTLALCRGCVTDLAEAAGITTNQARVQELEATIIRLRQDLEVARQVDAEIKAALTRIAASA